MEVLNPYTAGNPIGDAAGFFGREDVLKQVRRALRRRNESAIVLFGQRRIGKTSVLLQLEKELERNGTAAAVYFDLQDKATKPLVDVLYELAQRIAVKAGLPACSRSTFDTAGEYFRDIFLPTVTESLAGKELVLLLDEFDVLDSAEDRGAGRMFFPYLRAWMHTARSVRFVFVIGRRPEDLSIETIAAFKGGRAVSVSLLEEQATIALIRQSEANGGLRWTDAAVNEVLALTHGHAYLTQLLCSVVWDNAVERDSTASHPVDPTVVRSSVDEALRQGANAFQWIWDGLPPAERVVIAAMAEAASIVVSHDQLIEALTRSGVRLIVRELELAPETLAEWELLRSDSNGNYTFSVPILRTWVAKHRPLRRAKDELDRLDPLAEQLFQTGQRFYALAQNDEAQAQLRHALRINPNHLKSRLLLGRLLLETQHIDESVKVLEEAFAYDRPAARSDLVRALLASSDGNDEDQQLRVYSRIFDIDPDQPIARERFEHIQTARRQRALVDGLVAASEYEATEAWSSAIDIYRKLLDEFPNHEEVFARQQHAQSKSVLAQRYIEAVVALDNGQPASAQKLLAQVIAEAPTYKEAARYLLRATTGTDVADLLARLGESQAALEQAQFDWERRDAENRTRTAELLGEVQDITAQLENTNKLLEESRLEQIKLGAVARDEIAYLHSQVQGLESKVKKQKFVNELPLTPATLEPAKVPQHARKSRSGEGLPTSVGALSAKAQPTLERVSRQTIAVACPICGRHVSREDLGDHLERHKDRQ